jgi:hypothetical protein
MNIVHGLPLYYAAYDSIQVFQIVFDYYVIHYYSNKKGIGFTVRNKRT